MSFYIRYATHMRLHRFYVLQPLGEEVVIQDVSLVTQWFTVFRYRTGDSVILFNGDGNDYQYTLQSITKKDCVLVFVRKQETYIPPSQVTLYLSIIKKDNFELVVQKATELGVTTIVPILSSRSEKKNLSMERLRKIAVEASEQCGRGDIPTLAEIAPLNTISKEHCNGKNVLLFSLYCKSLKGDLPTLREKHILLFIGPEGGWSEADIAHLTDCGALSYSLGKTTLRAETAAIAACTLLCL